jgi:DNA-binding SARP family transcriptional activator
MTIAVDSHERRVRNRAATGTRLALLNGFELGCDGIPVSLPMGAQRLVALLALHGRPALRPFVAGTLWLDTSEERAHANLRSTLWRLHRCKDEIVEVRGQQLRLGDGVRVDVAETTLLARRALDKTADSGLELAPDLFSGDLLPDWYEDWVLIEREQFRQLRLRALDSLCERLTRAGRLGEALEAGLVALAGEPLRESAHRAVVRIHLADGNVGEAVRQYHLCRRLLEEQLGVEPSEQMECLFQGVTIWRRFGDRGLR